MANEARCSNEIIEEISDKELYMRLMKQYPNLMDEVKKIVSDLSLYHSDVVESHFKSEYRRLKSRFNHIVMTEEERDDLIHLYKKTDRDPFLRGILIMTRNYPPLAETTQKNLECAVLDNSSNGDGAAEYEKIAALIEAEYTLLDEEEEKCLFRIFRYSKDPYIREILIYSNFGLVMAAAKKFYPPEGFNKSDFYQYGVPGLVRAVDAFDPETNNKFSTYGTTAIKHEMGKGILPMLRLKYPEKDNALDLYDHYRQETRRYQKTIECCADALAECKTPVRMAAEKMAMDCFSSDHQDPIVLFRETAKRISAKLDVSMETAEEKALTEMGKIAKNDRRIIAEYRGFRSRLMEILKNGGRYPQQVLSLAEEMALLKFSEEEKRIITAYKNSLLPRVSTEESIGNGSEESDNVEVGEMLSDGEEDLDSMLLHNSSEKQMIIRLGESYGWTDDETRIIIALLPDADGKHIEKRTLPNIAKAYGMPYLKVLQLYNSAKKKAGMD